MVAAGATAHVARPTTYLADLRPKVDPVTGIDLSLIEENLKLTPWERILANDDAVNFGHMLREAVIRANAAS